MKKVLSLLVAFVFLQTQSWALSGGPVYPGNTKVVAGTYAGTLVGQVNLAQPTVGANGLGIFVISIPTSGFGSGSFAYFQSGETFFGTIVGIADPDELILSALMQATATQTIASLSSSGGVGSNQVQTLTTPSALANGELVANLDPRAGVQNGQAGFRLNGTATLGIRNINTTTGVAGPTVFSTLSVDGFQQSTTTSTSGTGVSSLTGSGSSTTGG